MKNQRLDDVIVAHTYYILHGLIYWSLPRFGLMLLVINLRWCGTLGGHTIILQWFKNEY
jgi:hypothetical protein